MEVVNETLSEFDCNGDGQPDTFDDLLDQYQSWGPYFIWSLRQALGPNAIMIGNSAGALSDSNLNGITIEMENCIDYQDCSSSLMSQYLLSTKPAVGLVWLTHSEVMPAEEQCVRVAALQLQMPWLLAGTDYFDGSHVVCNNNNTANSAGDPTKTNLQP
eukprot:TRINITY_DN2232_c0_g1_i3.p3 TRINITY_DN2232_c0_g1~~TRINITY_DN2232_c0_g1_i3.p3  ORF type:complete len:159 (-),score=36.17 TRINITY_DN2232_c0_g1_i3:229-705(-)